MDRVTFALRQFLLSHDLPVKGVSITISFPEEHLAHYAESYMKKDLKPFELDTTFLHLRTGELTVNGIGINFV